MLRRRRALPPGVKVRHALDLSRYLPYRIHLLAMRIAQPPSAVLSSGLVLKARDWRVLATLGGFGPLTNAEISKVVGMDAATITRSVQYLHEHGLVTLRASTADRRKQLISLTAAGGLAHDEIAPVRRAAATQIEGLLSARDRKDFYRILDRLDEALNELDQEEPEVVWEES